MKVFKSIFLLLVFSAQMLVFTMERAYCSGNMVEIELNGKPRICACGHAYVSSVSKVVSLKATPCCSSETIEKSSDTISSSDVSLVSISLPENRTSYKYAEVTPFRAENGIVTFSNPPPVKRKSKACILFQNFKSAVTV
jgi:hypothetical protein